MGNQTTNLNSTTLSEMTDLIEKSWSVLSEHLPRVASSLFIPETIGAGQGSTKRIDEFDGETFAAVKPEGSNSEKASVGVGYSKTMTARTFSKEIDITLEMRNDNKYNVVGQMIRDLISFCPNRKELDLTHRLTFASSTSYTDMNGETVTTSMGDTYALAYATHTLAFSSTTYSNRVTGDPAFSQGAFEAAQLLANSQTYNNFGQWRSMNFSVIATWRDPSTMRTVKQLMASEGDIDGAHAGIVNVYKNGMSHVVLPRLATTATGAYDSTKRRWWFYIAPGMQGWQAYVGDWIAPTLKSPGAGNNGEDIHSLNWTYMTYCRYGIEVLSGKGCIASLPTS
uniref:Capsid protein n=1 Tax=viral metagenome TaxID=1070528 RepID=A0A6M3XTI2_9ZZZZ